MGLLTLQKEVTADNVTRRQIAYTYDDAGRLTSENRSGAGVGGRDELARYAYDKAGRLVRYTLEGAVTNYAYDRAGNLLSDGENTDGESSSYTYNALGARIENEQIRENQNAGNQNADLKDGSHDTDYLPYLSDYRATWQRDWETQVGTVVQNNFETVTKHYVADYLSPANRDILVTEDGSFTQRYAYDADGKRLSVELGYADGTARATTNADGEYGENPQSDIAVSIGKAWYRTSHLDSTLFAVEADGSVVAHMIYDPFGAPLLETYTDTNYSGLDNLNNFTGYAWDEVLGLYFAQNRFYDAATHRFTQEDAIKDGGNWYAYCGNDPLNYVDEDGQVFFLATAAIGAAIGGVVGGVTAGVREYKAAKASGLSGADLAKQVAVSAGKSALAGAAVGGAIGLGAGAIAAAATAGATATTAAVTATTAGKAAATVALATTTSTSWQQGSKVGQGQKLTAGSVLTDTARNATTAIAYTIPETRVVVGTVNAVKSGNEAIAAAKSGNTKQAVVSGASAALNIAAAASGVKEIAPKVSGYFPKAQCPEAEKAASGGSGQSAELTDVAKGYSSLDDGLNFSQKALEHMGQSGRQVPLQTLQDAIKYGKALPDPRGSNAIMYYSTIHINGKMYNLEVLYDKATNTVFHFKYARNAMGNLPTIPKLKEVGFMLSKDQLWYLINGLLKGSYNIKDFCTEFSRIYDLETDYEELSKEENIEFMDLSEMAARFSDDGEELKIPNMYFSAQDIIDKVTYITQKLAQ